MLQQVRVVVAALALAAVACSSSSEEISYQFEENGCNTGKHTFQSTADYCAALLDDALNLHCAATLRQQAHTANCR